MRRWRDKHLDSFRRESQSGGMKIRVFKEAGRIALLTPMVPFIVAPVGIPVGILVIAQALWLGSMTPVYMFLAALPVVATLIWLFCCPKSRDGNEPRREPPHDARHRQTERPREASPPPLPHMSRDQARSILGLSPGASVSEINTAWKHLMRRIHPDAGGTDGMAMLLNEARDVLLGKAG